MDTQISVSEILQIDGQAKGDEESTLVAIVVEAKVPRAFGTRRTRLAPHRHLHAPATGCEPVGVFG